MTSAEKFDRGAWLEERRKGIGGSDAATILGLSPYEENTPLSLWLDKTGQAFEKKSSIPMRLGSFLEAFVRELYEEHTGRPVIRPSGIIKSTEYPFMLASLDGHGVEFKTASAFSAHRWGVAPDGEIPDEYYCQVQHYMAVTSASEWDVAVLIGNNDFRIYKVMRDNDFIKMLIEKEKAFWELIESKTPPPMDGSSTAREYLAQRFPKDTLPAREADHTETMLAIELKAVEAKIDEYEQRKETLKNLIIEKIGDASGIKGEFGSFSYKLQKGRTTTDWKDLVDFLKVDPKVIDSFTKTSNPQRVFRSTWKTK